MSKGKVNDKKIWQNKEKCVSKKGEINNRSDWRKMIKENAKEKKNPIRMFRNVRLISISTFFRNILHIFFNYFFFLIILFFFFIYKYDIQ